VHGSSLTARCSRLIRVAFVLFLLSPGIARSAPSFVIQEPFKVPPGTTAKEKFLIARQAAESGDPAGQCLLGECFHNGWGCTKNPYSALTWLLRSASNSFFRAQFKVADLAVEMHNFPLAQRWYRACVERGEADAQFRLANLYDANFKIAGRLPLFKVHTVSNYRTADWYMEDAEHRQTRAYPIAVDYTEAAKLYQKAANQGHKAAQNNLAVMYAYGQGVRGDLLEAYKWFRIAGRGTTKENGYPMVQNLQTLVQSMTPKQIEQADLRASK